MNKKDYALIKKTWMRTISGPAPSASRHAPGLRYETPADDESGKEDCLKLCILSDSHDHREQLTAAVAEAKAPGAQAVLHCGDLVAPSTLHAIVSLNLPIHLIHGNNTGDLFHLCRFAQECGHQVHYYGQDAALDWAQRRIFMVHYPHYARAMALTGDYDLVCNGHEHRPIIQRIRNIRGKRRRASILERSRA